ncbi:MAG: alpha-D-ribose 1-methylphosphonate 5-triphosphate diphosphatase [Pseudomonadota bacterium]
MLDTPQLLDPAPSANAPTNDLTFVNAHIVLPDQVENTTVSLEGGVIAGVGYGDAPTSVHDCQGDYLIPGIVDVHTDHVETHVHPRSTVQWAFLPSLLAHDGVVISGGTTTVFDSLCVGASMKRPERREILAPLIDALEQGIAANAFRADHLLHLRCEISDPETSELARDALRRPISRLVSVMDHTPGDRQSPNVERWFNHMIHEMEIDEEEGRERMAELFERSARVGAAVRAEIIEAANARSVSLMTHDDRTIEHVDQAEAEGIHISEFPTTLDAARRAKTLGLATIAGAPNYLRGGSQSGNVAVKELIQNGVVDALASDYVPRSLLDCAFALAADPEIELDLPATIQLVTANPARLTGLTDRGRIEVGLRADLAQVRVVEGQPIVRGVWREGERVF